MKALSVKQPWCELIASGRKIIEVRSWQTHHRGPLLVCASSQPNLDASMHWLPWVVDQASERVKHLKHCARGLVGRELRDVFLPVGVAICVVELVDVRSPLSIAEDEAAACCGLGFEDWCWVLKNPRRVEPVPIKGRLNLYEVDDSLVRFFDPDANAALTRASTSSTD